MFDDKADRDPTAPLPEGAYLGPAGTVHFNVDPGRRKAWDEADYQEEARDEGSWTPREVLEETIEQRLQQRLRKRGGGADGPRGSADAEGDEPEQPEADATGDAQQETPRSGDDGSESRFQDQDTAELALLARLHKGGGMDGLSLEQAVAEVMWAMETSERGPTGLAERKPVLKWSAAVRALCVAVAMTLILFLLLTLNRANFQEISVEKGVLLARGGPNYVGEEPVAGTADYIEVRSLASCAGLPVGTLRNLRDVALTHRGTWRSIRINRVVKFSDFHVWLEALDGTGVRIQSGQVLLRLGQLGDEERVLGAAGEAYLRVTAAAS